MNSSTNKRKERDLMKLMMSNYDVHLTDENNTNDLHVIFKGPKDSPYEGVNNTEFESFLIKFNFFSTNEIMNIGNLESSCYDSRSISLQITFYWISQ